MIRLSRIIRLLAVSLAAGISFSALNAKEPEKENFYPLPDGRPGIMDKKMKDFLESTSDNPTQKKLDTMLANVDRIVVERFNGPEICSTSDAQKIAQFKETLKIIEDPRSFGHCMCFGNPQIYLYSGKQKIAHMSCQHGFAIRWNDGWKWDAVLKDGTGLINWLAANGAPELKQEVTESIALQEQSKKSVAKVGPGDT